MVAALKDVQLNTSSIKESLSIFQYEIGRNPLICEAR
jgi:hypothetical protein